MKFQFMREQLNLYLVTDRTWLGERSLDTVVDEALGAGVTFLQYREKHLNDEDNMAVAKQLKIIANAHQVPFVINDSVALALAIDADGVHVGQSDLEATKVRARIGTDKILGVTARTVEEALRAEAAGADYIGVGAAFQTGTKQDTRTIGIESVKAICEAVDIPVVAIGGIHSGNILKLKGTGVQGVAVVSAILAKENIVEETKRLKVLSMQLCVE
jgi:thiamine-phosphate pyrophosphorylase